MGSFLFGHVEKDKSLKGMGQKDFGAAGAGDAGRDARLMKAMPRAP